MYVSRHEVEIDIVERRSTYDFNVSFLKSCLETLRDPTRSDLLSMVGSTAATVYNIGILLSAEQTECALALTIAAQTNTALFVFREITEQPPCWSIGDGPPVTYIKPVDESHVHAGRWMDAVYQAIISRQRECLTFLQPITYDELNQSSTYSSNPQREYYQVEKLRVLASAALDPTRPFAAEFKRLSIHSRPKHVPPINRRAEQSVYQLIDALEARDAKTFNTALAERLWLHREQFAEAEDRETRLSDYSLVPLPLIVFAVLAHDRGIPIEVESDYLPTSWVRGDVFRSR